MHSLAAHIKFNVSIIAAAPEELFAIGLCYLQGNGVKQNLIAAHKWFNLAALKGNLAAKRQRYAVARDMTAAQIAQAQREYRLMLTLH